MPASRDLNTRFVTIFVKLTDEVVDVWRPVAASEIGHMIYRILPEGFDADVEAWEFSPGEAVRVEVRDDPEGKAFDSSGKSGGPMRTRSHETSV